MEVQWLTYDELAERLGIGRESARTLVKRKRWARQTGNDGRARIGLPVEELEARSESAVRAEQEQDQPGEQAGDRSPDRASEHSPEVMAVLTRHIERLEAQLEEALKRAGERDELLTQRDVLTTQVDALRAALAAAERDRDRWHDVATLKPEPVAPVERRSWWRRLAG
jgi:hypothetical protein